MPSISRSWTQKTCCCRTRGHVYALGKLVLWARKGKPHPKTLAELSDARYGRIALANPRVAPYGMAARQALQNARLWDTLQSRFVYGENIQQTHQFAAMGNVDVAFCFPLSGFRWQRNVSDRS